MKYNRRHATAAWGTMAKDWEVGIDYPRMIRERFQRAQDAVKAAGLGAVLCFNVDNVRYVTGTHIGEWVRDKFDRYALCPRDGPAYLWDPAPPAKRISSPWIADRVGAPISNMQGALAPAIGAQKEFAQQIRKMLVHYGIEQRADRHRPARTADAARARGRGHRGGRRPAGDAGCARGQDARRDRVPEGGRGDGRRALTTTSARRSGPARARTSWWRSRTTGCSAWARSASSA